MKPQWVLFFMLDGLVVLYREPCGTIVQSLLVPRIVKGAVEVAFMELIDRKWRGVVGDNVHAHYVRYVEVYPPTFEGAKIC